MDIAVKFCGGCNPRYDRGQVYDNFLTMLSGHHKITTVDYTKIYDILVVIRGCTGCDDDYLDINAKDRYFIHNVSEADALIEKFKKL